MNEDKQLSERARRLEQKHKRKPQDTGTEGDEPEWYPWGGGQSGTTPLQERILDGGFELGNLALHWNPSNAWYGWAELATPILFSSGWETGDWTEWTHKVGSGTIQPTIDSVVKYSGTYSQKCDNIDLFYSAGSDKTFTEPFPIVYYIHGRVRIDAITMPTNKVVLLLGESRALGFGPYGDSGTYFAIKNVAGTYKLGIWDDYNYLWIDGGLTLTLGIWYKIDLKVTRLGSPNNVKLYVNDSLIATANNTWTTPIGVWAGAGGANAGTGQGYITMWVDDVSVEDLTGPVHTGNYSAKLVGNNPGSWNLGWISQELIPALLTNSILSFTFWFKTLFNDGVPIHKLNVYWEYSDTTYDEIWIQASAWTQVNLLPYLDPGKNITGIWFTVSDVNIAYIDGISLLTS